MSKPISNPHQRRPSTPRHSISHDSVSRSLGTSWRTPFTEQSVASIAEQAIARDLADTEGEAAVDDDEDETHRLEGTTTQERIAQLNAHSLTGNYRRPSVFAGPPSLFLGVQPSETIVPIDQDHTAAIGEERSLLRDNNIIPPKHPRRRESEPSKSNVGSVQRLMHRISISTIGHRKRSAQTVVDEEAVLDGDANGEPTERSGLLGNGAPLGRDPTKPYGGEDDPENIDAKWEEAVMSGKIQTTWQRETKVLLRYSLPLMLTFLLQNSLTMTSIFTVGHIGKIELGAVSIGSMTANITGYALYHGLATSLDTLCAQAYGSGKKTLVGLQLQRMVWFLWTITIPIAVVWFFGTQILLAILPEPEIAYLAGRYLKVLIIGAPGYACFESAKRYVQAQGRFDATMYVLLIAAPLNIFMHWLFVWQFRWGFIGCPIAVTITEILMPLLLLAYVRFVGGMECWDGFTWKAFNNWGPMVRLALPGLVMVMAEFLAFEILTLASARFGATYLAANTVLQSVSVVAFCLPFPVSVATSTRVANLIGATLPEAAKVTARVNIVIGTVIGLFNAIVLLGGRKIIPLAYTNDAEVVALAAAVMPVNAAFQLFDSLASQMNGLLRGLGKQEIGGYVGLFAYYAVAMPISFGFGFGLDYRLYGLWSGPAVALGIVAVVEGIYIMRFNWQRASDEAAARNAAG